MATTKLCYADTEIRHLSAQLSRKVHFSKHSQRLLNTHELRVRCPKKCECNCLNLGVVKSARTSCPQVQPVPRLSIYSQYANMCIYTQQGYTQHINTDRKHSAHVNTNSTNCLILFISLTGQDESLLMENTYIHMCVCIYMYICTMSLQ